MSLFGQAFAYLFDGANWVSGFQAGLGEDLVDHLALAGLSLLVTVLIAVPLGLLIGHTGRGRTVALVAANASRALPTLGLLSLLVVGVSNGLLAPVVVFVLLGVPPLLAGAYAGVESVDRQTVDAARAMGMTGRQVLGRVELPLAAPLLIGGLRAAALQIVATTTIASFFGYTSLGSPILSGLSSANYAVMVAGCILVIALALSVDGLFGLVQRLTAPRGVSRGRGSTTTARGRHPLTAPTGAPIPEGN